jgi:7-cyano-7-deazaguanine reductase
MDEVKKPKIWSNPSILKSLKNPSQKTYVSTMQTSEVTFLGAENQPDFADVHIKFTANEKIIELKSLKLYFFDFRNRLLSYERFINVVFDDLMTVYMPQHLVVTVTCNPRGGIRSKLVADSSKRPKDIVVSLRREISLKDVGVEGETKLGQFLAGVVDLEVVSEYPSNTTAKIRILDRDLKKLKKKIGDKCHLVHAAIGGINT